MDLLIRIRERLRNIPIAYKAIYLAQSLYRSIFGRLVVDVRRARRNSSSTDEVAVCLRFRDEARYLAEWLDYHQAAGVSHFFLYNNFSADNYLPVLQPWLDDGHVTLVDWPRAPASPSAEEDCIRRALGRFRWVGFLDTDEFVVIRNGRSIGEFLDGFQDAPGVGLHWRLFGSSMHRARPMKPVILAYQLREPKANGHIKTFVRPERAAQCRNSHCWFYSPMGTTVDERGQPIYGSIEPRIAADFAWINHYYCKSEEDYLEKAARKSTLDRIGITFPTRRREWLERELALHNDVVDTSAVAYYQARCKALERPPILLQQSNSLVGSTIKPHPTGH